MKTKEYENAIFKLKFNGNGKMEKAIGYGENCCANCKNSLKANMPGVKLYCESEKVFKAMGLDRKDDVVPDDIAVSVSDEGFCRFFEK